MTSILSGFQKSLAFVIPREGVERRDVLEGAQERELRRVIPREGVESCVLCSKLLS
jgi:hypothetical protein